MVCVCCSMYICCVFFFDSTANPRHLHSFLHDALPISAPRCRRTSRPGRAAPAGTGRRSASAPGRRRSPTCSRGSSRSEEHTSELQSRQYLVCRLLLEKKKKEKDNNIQHKTCISIHATQ